MPRAHNPLSATSLCSCIVINFAPMVHMDHFLSFLLYRRMKLLDYVNNVTKKPALCEHTKTKAQISSAVIARLRRAFVFATYFLHLAAIISSLQLPFMARTDRFLSNLIENPKDRFFRYADHVFLCIQKSTNKGRNKTVSGLNQCIS